MTDDIRISPYGELLVYQPGYTPDKVRAIIKERNLKGLRIFSMLPSERIEDIGFLKDYTFLEHLGITSYHDYDFSCLKALTNLKKLTISSDGKNEIDLSQLHDLEELVITWRPKKIVGLENCRKLNYLCLVGFKEKDFKKISFLTNLKTLKVKTAAVESLEGIDGLPHLERVEFGNCRKLKSISALNGRLHLTKLDFNACSVIRDFSALNDLPALSVFYIIDCKSIESIKFIDHFPALDEFGVLGNTDILDGDTTPAKRIKYLVYYHRKHYNVRIATPEADAQQKRNMDRLNEIVKGQTGK